MAKKCTCDICGNPEAKITHVSFDVEEPFRDTVVPIYNICAQKSALISIDLCSECIIKLRETLTKTLKECESGF